MRAHFSEPDILVLGGSPVSFTPYAAQQRITLTVFSSEWVQQADDYMANGENSLRLHIKVDSGMGRIGVRTEEELLNLYHEIHASKNFQLDGIFTHFATADEEDTTVL